MNPYLIALVVSACLASWLWSRRRWYALSWKLRGENGLPVLGSLILFLDTAKVVDNMQRYCDVYGNLSKIWMGPQLLVMIKNPAHIEQIMNSTICNGKGMSYRFIEQTVGPGLITSTKHRKLLNPSFSYKIIERFVPIFNKHLRVLEDCFEENCDGSEFDIMEKMKRCSMDLICATTMDYQMQTQFGDNVGYFETIESILSIIGKRMFNPTLQPIWSFQLSTFGARQRRNLIFLKDHARKIIEGQIVKQNAHGNKITESTLLQNDVGTKEKHIFIDRALKLSLEKKALTLDDVETEIKTVLMAGFETTATTLAFVMLMLAMHPEYQERVYHEMRPLLLAKNDDEDITTPDLCELPYLDMFIKETLRLFPAVPFMTRNTTRDIQIGEHLIPAGVELVLGAMAMQRCKDYYPQDPLRFDPDNFLPENIATRHPYSYIPFSGGERSCIGTRYANTVLRMTVVYVLKKYRLTTRLTMAELRFKMYVTLHLINKHLVMLHRR